MNRNITIDVRDVAKSTITRERGNEAFDALEKIIKDNSPDTVTIDLTKSDMISLSFLDGIIVNVKKRAELERINFYFIVNGEDVLKKLRKAVTIRDFKGYYKCNDKDDFKEIEKIEINSNMSSEIVKNKELMIQA